MRVRRVGDQGGEGSLPELEELARTASTPSWVFLPLEAVPPIISHRVKCSQTPHYI